MSPTLMGVSPTRLCPRSICRGRLDHLPPR